MPANPECRTTGIMGKALIATSALAFAGAMAVGPASAADKLSLGLGGYMEQWFGYANRDDTNVDKDGKSVSDGGFDTQSDAEVYFVGSLESDMGLKYSVVVELEGNQNADKAAEIDESFLRVSGEFGNLEFGARDHALVRMHHGTNDVGIGLRAGDTQKWFPGAYLDTAGHVHSGGDDVKLNYISPRISGLEVGLSYAPDSSNENAVTGAPNGNDEASWGVGLNFTQPFGDGSVTLSLGHQVLGAAGAPVDFMSAAAAGVGEEDNRLTVSNHERHEAEIKAYNKGKELEPVKKGGTVDLAPEIVASAVAATNAINDATSSMVKGGDSTFTNFGVGVGFGAFHFNVSYATFDSGAYTTMPANVSVTPGRSGERCKQPVRRERSVAERRSLFRR